MSQKKKLTYKDAGVDLELYQQAMQKLPRLMRRTHTPRVMDMPGGFAGLFRLDHNSRPNYREPILVSGTDGVGTKLKVAIMAQKYDTIGIDLVGMCVNDCLCMGAEPLFFLDYLATGKDNPDLIERLVEGISDGCEQSQLALLGGETAIMPDVYNAGDFDMAGFCVGVVERKKLITGTKTIRSGDVILGLASSGFHANGYSLIRKVVFDHAGLSIDEYVPELEATVADVLLKPTQLYVRPILDILNYYHAEGEDFESDGTDDETARSVIRGMAHITGGGLVENIERILPESCRVRIDRSSWETPAAFEWLQRLAKIDQDEMYRVFNMGIGYVIIVKPVCADSIQKQLSAQSMPSWVIGEVSQGAKKVELHG